mmetsp:Transcript_91465/g.261232  ORF Transcript_91465/g.261232 Transcript_91465/m.261232 type:complete len:221 (-) Transcript_91465:1734-2396(-)
MRGLLSLVMVAASLTAATAWSLGRRCADSATMAVEGGFNRGGNDMSRRSLLERLSVSSVLPAVVAVAATSSPEAAVAKGGPASEAELKRMKVGYDGLNYLLDKENFEKITTKCNPECNRNPDAIREYVGRRPSLATNFQRSTSHALRSKQRGSPQPPSLASLPLVDASTAPPDRTNLMITPQVLGAAFDGAPSLQDREGDGEGAGQHRGRRPVRRLHRCH